MKIKKILTKNYFNLILKNLVNIIYYFCYLLIFLLFVEILIRIIIFFPTNSDVFKYGLKKSVIFDVVDLSKMQITVVDKKRKLKNTKKIFNKEKVWIFGGSTTEGSGCEGPYSSSWPIEVSKINKSFPLFQVFSLEVWLEQPRALSLAVKGHLQLSN